MTEYLVAGLGNPGDRYAQTRHNIGFMVVDRLAMMHGGSWRSEHQALTCRLVIANRAVLLAKPQTFMNNSGSAVRSLASWYRVPPEHVVVVSDDLDLPVGRLRVRARGSAGGHNGLRSIIAELGSQEFPRIRLGIGRPATGEAIEWVLSPFMAGEQALVTEMIDAAVEAVETVVQEDVVAAMNRCNGKPEQQRIPALREVRDNGDG
jgi:PTH1 family peptidyl-tRNA hydrolase